MPGMAPIRFWLRREVVGGAVERVAAALRDRVDAAAGESALPHVVGRDDELNLLDGVEADRLRAGLAAGRAGRRQAEHVVADRAVDLHVVVAVVAAGDADRRVVGRAGGADVEVRRRAREVVDAAGDGGQRLDGPAADVLGRAGARRVDERRGGDDVDRLTHRRQLQLEVGGLPPAELDQNLFLLLILEAAHRDRDRVRCRRGRSGCCSDRRRR